MSEELEHIKARLHYLKARRTYLREDIPILEQDRDWADANASAQTWYHANVKVNVAKRYEEEAQRRKEIAARERMTIAEMIAEARRMKEKQDGQD